MNTCSAPLPRPYGLGHQVRLRPAVTAQPAGIAYDPAAQLNMFGGRPLVDQPEVMRQYTVTWNTTGNDNKTDDGG